MTALKEFDRLESTGIWRASPDEQRRDVLVSLGQNSLVISASNGTALAHWSLPTVKRQNKGQRPAIYHPDEEGDETIEIDDEVMIGAIEKLRRVIKNRRPRPGRLRIFIFSFFLLAAGAFALFTLPEQLVLQTLKVVPNVTKAEIGNTMLEHVKTLAGSPCHSRRSAGTLADLYDRLGVKSEGSALVMRGMTTTTTNLPGGFVLLNRTLVEDYESPEVAAGFILSALVHNEHFDPFEGFLRFSGIKVSFRLLTTGAVSKEATDAYAEHVLSEATNLPNMEILLNRFKQAQLRSTPFAYALDPLGESTLALIEGDTLANEITPPLLPDADWVRLQGICQN